MDTKSPRSTPVVSDGLQTDLAPLSAGGVFGVQKAEIPTPGGGPEFLTTKRLHEIASLRDGWNGAGSVGPTLTAVSDAETFLATLDLRTMMPPFITLTDDGEINFIWKRPYFTMDLGFIGDGTYCYFARVSERRTFHADNVPASEALPQELANVLGAAL